MIRPAFTIYSLVRKLLALSALLLAGPVLAYDALDRTVEPTERVGAITARSSEADLIAIYGKANVSRAENSDRISVLFDGTPEEVRIQWVKDHHSPEKIIIDGPDSPWKTVDGVSIGTTLTQLERINGRPFDITGSNWDSPIRVVSWKGGKLPPQLQIDLEPGPGVKNPDRLLRSGKQFLESTNPQLVRAKPQVRRIILDW